MIEGSLQKAVTEGGGVAGAEEATHDLIEHLRIAHAVLDDFSQQRMLFSRDLIAFTILKPLPHSLLLQPDDQVTFLLV